MSYLFVMKGLTDDIYWFQGEINGMVNTKVSVFKIDRGLEHHGHIKQSTFKVSYKPNDIHNGTLWMEKFDIKRAARLFYADALEQRDKHKKGLETAVERCRYLSRIEMYGTSDPKTVIETGPYATGFAEVDWDD